MFLSSGLKKTFSKESCKGGNHATRSMFLLNHASRTIFSTNHASRKRSKYIANLIFSILKASLKKTTTRKMHRQICDLSRENVPYISVRTAERTANELACKPAPSEGRKKNPASKVKRAVKSEQKKKKEFRKLRFPWSPFLSRISPLALDRLASSH